METQKTRWEEDFELIENEGLFEEYLEMGVYVLLYSHRFLHCTFFNI